MFMSGSYWCYSIYIQSIRLPPSLLFVSDIQLLSSEQMELIILIEFLGLGSAKCLKPSVLNICFVHLALSHIPNNYIYDIVHNLANSKQ